ncbi:hypothetical protein N9R79_10380 [Vibrio sp.]|nr:hypothetical protein [Vibrio sp.]
MKQLVCFLLLTGLIWNVQANENIKLQLSDEPCISSGVKTQYESLGYNCMTSESYEVSLEDAASSLQLSTNDDDSMSSYWAGWLSVETAPMISNFIENNHFGIGIWLPSEIEASKNEFTYDELLMEHGLRFSLGIGDRVVGEPRFRIDYQWHDDYHSQYMLQLEVPME